MYNRMFIQLSPLLKIIFQSVLRELEHRPRHENPRNIPSPPPIDAVMDVRSYTMNSLDFEVKLVAAAM